MGTLKCQVAWLMLNRLLAQVIHGVQICNCKLQHIKIRRLTDGSVIQRWLCRDRGYRFSDPQKPLKERISIISIAE